MQFTPKLLAVSLQSQQQSQPIARDAKSLNFFDLMTLLMVCSTIVLLTATCNYLSKVIRPSIKSSETDKLPCRSCQYFNSNYHLKCAVRPTDVMTDRASDCRDYETIDSRLTNT
jgi:hypothetical protein